MKLSTDRILTTHVGSLPRPQDVVDLIFAQDRGEPIDQAKFDATVQRAVEEVIRQASGGGRRYSQRRRAEQDQLRHLHPPPADGVRGRFARPTPQDLDDFPDYRDKLVKEGHSATYKRPVCKGEIKVKSLEPVKEDIARMKTALAKANVTEGFMNSVSPGTVAVFQPNEYYPTHEAYMAAVAEGMRAEYEEIVKSGLLLQLDCPDLAMGRHSRFKNLDEAGFLRNAEIQVEALNHALANVPADRVRMHVCWGNYEGPHTHDIALTKILPIILKAKPMAFLLEGANPRHAHEWEVWKTYKLPADKVLVPGVVETTSNFVEHPEVVAQRIVRYAEVIGRERILAGSDCGFGTFAGFGPVHPSVGWMKLKSLAEGAAIASKKLWGKAPRPTWGRRIRRRVANSLDTARKSACATTTNSGRLIDIRIERRDAVHVHDLEGLGHGALRAGHAHLAAGPLDLSVAGHQHADSGAVDVFELGDIDHQLARALFDQALDGGFEAHQFVAEIQMSGQFHYGQIRFHLADFRSWHGNDCNPKRRIMRCAMSKTTLLAAVRGAAGRAGVRASRFLGRMGAALSRGRSRAPARSRAGRLHRASDQRRRSSARR